MSAMLDEVPRIGQDCSICGAKGHVFMTITQEDDGTETFGVECWECGAEFASQEAENILQVLGEALDKPQKV